jgi:hypothetical protein
MPPHSPTRNPIRHRATMTPNRSATRTNPHRLPMTGNDQPSRYPNRSQLAAANRPTPKSNPPTMIASDSSKRCTSPSTGCCTHRVRMLPCARCRVPTHSGGGYSFFGEAEKTIPPTLSILSIGGTRGERERTQSPCNPSGWGVWHGRRSRPCQTPHQNHRARDSVRFLPCARDGWWDR